MKKSKDSNLVISIALVLCVLRYLIRNSLYIVEIMAAFNVIALNYSVWCMFNDTEDKLDQRNKERNIGKELAKKNKTILRKIRKWGQNILFFVCSFVYLIYFKNGVVNDMLSIIALCVALETNNFSNRLSNYCFSKT